MFFSIHNAWGIMTSFISHLTESVSSSFSVSKWSLQILLLSINTSFCSFRIIFNSRPYSRFIVRIDKLTIVPFKMCFSLNSWSKIFLSKFFNFVGRVYNKFIIITVTWSEMPDHVSLTVTVIIIYIYMLLRNRPWA